MTRRERVRRAIRYQSVDKVPVRYYYCPVGYYEHGDKLNDLYATLPGDFEPFRRVEPTGPAPEEVDADGNFHSFRKDAWGTTWEYRIFGVTGIPYDHPIKTPEQAEVFRTPPHAPVAGPEFDRYAARIRSQQEQDYFTMSGCGNLYEMMIALYGDENVLCDMALDEVGINKLADAIVEYDSALLQRAVKAGVDCVTFGDDYGTERAMLMSPELWRSFLKPRLARLFRPAADAGIPIHFHSCGQIFPILGDLSEIGVTSVWPQLPAYNMVELAAHCRSLGLAVEVHTDRAYTMTHGTPAEVRELVKWEYDVFRMQDGGAWFYIEADNGFPYANLEALVQTIAEIR